MLVVRTLGTAEIEIGETRILPSSPRKFALLLYLAAERGRPVSRATLQDLIFPDQPEKNARHSLRELVYQLRQSGARLSSTTHGIQLESDGVESDLDALLATSRLTNEHLRQLEYGFLPGYSPEHSEAFCDWLASYRARSSSEVCRAVVAEIRRARMVGDWKRADLAARTCLALDSLNEEATLALAEVLALDGAKAKAIQLLDAYVGEVGIRSHDLRVPATVLRRRIGERPTAYQNPARLPFVGRDTEMRILHDCLGRANAGQNQCVAIVGEAGIGKTRLVSEFRRIVQLDGIHVASTAAQPHDIHRPFGAFADLFKDLIEMPGALGVSPDSMQHLRRMVTQSSQDPRSFAHAIRESDSTEHGMIHSIIDLIDAVATEGTLLVTIEDISSLDDMSRRLLGFLVSARRRRQFCLILTTRDLSALSAIPAECLTTIRLDGIDASAAAALIDFWFEREESAVDAPMREWLRATSAGNPLFLESLLAHYSSTQERFSISPNLLKILRHRIDRLSGEAAVALQMCAILGKHATIELVSEATQLARYALTRGIGELEVARLIKSDGQRVQPMHALIADAALQSMSPIERQMAHQHAALSLEERLGDERSAALYWDCAEHWLAASNTDRALAGIRRCASHAVAMGLPGSAATMIARVLTLDIAGLERAELCEQLIAAADAVADSELVMRGLEGLRASRREVTHDDIEFAEFRARTRGYLQSQGMETDLLRCVTSTSASAEHRVSAATQLLKYADTILEPQIGLAAIAALPDTVLDLAEDLDRIEYSMIRHTTLREHEAAARTARRALALAEEEPPVVRAKIMVNAVVALSHCGFADEAVAAAERFWNEVVDPSAARFRLMLGMFAAEHYFDMGARELSDAWLAAIDRHIEAYPMLSGDFACAVARLGMAMAIGDIAVATNRFAQLETAGAFEGGPLRKRWRRVSKLRINQMTGDYFVPENEWQELIASCKTGAMLGGVCDVEASTVVLRLIHEKRFDAAAQFVAAYIGEYRVSRAPLSRCMGVAASLASLSTSGGTYTHQNRVDLPLAIADGIPSNALP